MLNKIITYSFYILFFFTPLFWTSLNYELFEFNKMILVYFLTIIITSSWVVKMVKEKSLIFKNTPLTFPMLLFLASQILSTIFSIDPHTSIWGYYSRSNGGLLSIISYILLYFAFVSNFTKEQGIKSLKVALFGGGVVALYAIPEHFGFSPSCLILNQGFRADCWVQDVQARVFATLGQPNWLAAYLAMLIFPAIYFFLTSKTHLTKTFYLLLITSYYLTFTFTYSRGATLGLIAGLVVFTIKLLLCHPEPRLGGGKDINQSTIQNYILRLRLRVTVNNYLKPLLSIFLIFFIINLLFGSAFTRFNLSQIFKKSPQQQTAQSTKAPVVTQLESGGTESGQIRLIVWKGALDIFKAYPILGSGVETFAYSYYQFRPTEHNLVSEWDFLYNKAHNEYLNYLATTGVVGFVSYLLIILAFIFYCIKYYVVCSMDKKHNTNSTLLTTSLLASYITFLVQNFFSFSVVVINMLFFLIPAILFVSLGETKDFKLLNLKKYRGFLSNQLVQYIFPSIIIAISLILTSFLVRFYIADIKYSLSEGYLDEGLTGKAYNLLTEAISARPFEPLYRSQLGFAAAGASTILKDEDATLSAMLKDEALKETEKALSLAPKNVSLYRTAIRTYYQLTSLDQSFYPQTIEITDKTISLAPTDAKLYLNKALILQEYALSKDDKTNLEKDPDFLESLKYLEKAIELKPNYREGYISLAQSYHILGKDKEAKETLDNVFKLVPNDPEALQILKTWEDEKSISNN